MRKAPHQSAKEFKLGTKKKGNDGNIWVIIKTNDGSKRWSKINKKSNKKNNRKLDWKVKIEQKQKKLIKMKLSNTFIPINKLTSKNNYYITHDNGRRPFRIKANNEGIFVYTYKNREEMNNYDYTKLLFKTNKFIGYWSGFDTSIFEFHGNSMLIQLSEYEYVHIGCEIFSFNTHEIINDFISPVGNSDVPYPVAYSNNYVYFFLEKQYVELEILNTKPSVANAEKIYSEFYGHIGKVQHYKINKHKFKNLKYILKRL